MEANEVRILAGDIGGTKTALRLLDLAGFPLKHETFESQAFEEFEALLKALETIS